MAEILSGMGRIGQTFSSSEGDLSTFLWSSRDLSNLLLNLVVFIRIPIQLSAGLSRTSKFLQEWVKLVYPFREVCDLGQFFCRAKQNSFSNRLILLQKWVELEIGQIVQIGQGFCRSE